MLLKGCLTTGSPASGKVQLRELGRIVQSSCLPGVHRSPVAKRMTQICWPGEGSVVDVRRAAWCEVGLSWPLREPSRAPFLPSLG